MAEDFKALVAAQKETTRQLMSVEERADADTTNEAKSESARRGWETRQQNIALAEQEATTNQNQALYHAQEDGEDTANTGEEQSGYLSNLLNFFKKNSDKDGAAATEDEAKDDAGDKKSNSILGKIAGGIGGLVKKGKDATKSGLPSWKDLVIGGLAAAALVFLNHPKFKEFVEVIKTKIIPALTTLIDDYIIPIASILWDGMVKSFGLIMDLFSGLKESFALFGEGKWMEGITKFLSSIGTFLIEALDNVGTTLFNSIAVIFGMEQTDSVGGSIKKFFTDIYDSLVQSISDAWTSFTEFFTVTIPAKITEALGFLTKVGDYLGGIFSDLWAKVEEKVGDFAIFKLIDQTFGDLFASIKSIFGGDFSLETMKKLFGSLMDIAYAPINLIVNALKDIFKFGDPDTPFRLSKFIEEIFEKVINLFKSLIDIDFKKIAKEIIPDWAPDFIKDAMGVGEGGSGGDEKIDPTVVRQSEITKDLEEQRKELAGGDTHTGVDMISGGEKRVDKIKKLELELAEIKREREANKNSGGNTTVVGGDTNVTPQKTVVNQPTPIRSNSPTAAMASSAY